MESGQSPFHSRTRTQILFYVPAVLESAVVVEWDTRNHWMLDSKECRDSSCLVRPVYVQQDEKKGWVAPMGSAQVSLDRHRDLVWASVWASMWVERIRPPLVVNEVERS
jgi:hypothetical protein